MHFCFEMKRPSGGIGRESTVFYKRLADFVQEERQALFSDDDGMVGILPQLSPASLCYSMH